MQASNLHATVATAFEAAASANSANQAARDGENSRARTDDRRSHIPERYHCAMSSTETVLLKAPEGLGCCNHARAGVEPVCLGARSTLHRTA